MRRRDRAFALIQSRNTRLSAFFQTSIALIAALAFTIGDVGAMDSGHRGGPIPGSDSHPTEPLPQKPPKDAATTSDEYEDAIDLIADQNYQDAIAKLEAANAKYPGSADI